MGSYLPDKVFAVCTNQLGTGYKQLTIDNELRPTANQTVKFGSKGRVFLVKLDKKLTDDFTCKSGWSSGVGTAALGASMLGGLSVALSLSLIPVAGWVAGGLLAVGCVIWGIFQIAKSPTCSEMIGYEESKWVMYHQFVRFDSSNVNLKEKHLALVKNSMLICKEPGGVLLPFISESLARNAGKNIGHMNQLNMGLSTAVMAFTGFMFGLGFGWAAIAQFAVWSGVGYAFITPVVNEFGSFTGDLFGNETYNKIKENSYQNISYEKDPTEIKPTDNYDIVGGIMDLTGLFKLKKLLVENGASKNDIAQINEAIKTAQNNGGSMLPSKNPQMKEILSKIKKGEFGQQVKDIYTNKRGNMQGKSTETNARKAISSKKMDVFENRKSAAKGIGAPIQLLQPFVSAAIAESAVVLGAEIFDQDNNSSISVLSQDY